ncbi:MAG: DUF4397 domain-containing protein [Ignavibacteriae bacterium]|nr:DUF4397 domain-containing protein [Ignavibacteriota bacterium]
MNYKYILFAVAILTGSCTCAVDNNTTKEIEPTVKSRIRIINASAGAPALDCLDNDKVKKQSISFADTSSGYFEIGSGVRNIRLNSSSTNTALLSILSNFTAQKNHTIVAMGLPTAMLGFVLQDEPPQPISGKAFVRFIHTSKAVEDVNVSAGSSVLFSNKIFPSFTDFIAVDSGSVSINIYENKTNSSYRQTIHIQEGKIYTIMLKSDVSAVGNERLRPWVITD